MKKLNELIAAQFQKMCATGILFRSKVTGQQVWEAYIKLFENDPVFRDPQSSVHNCNLCNNFLRRYGNIVAINKELELTTLFDVEIPNTEYEPVVKGLSTLLKSKSIETVFLETFNELKDLPYEQVKIQQASYRLGVATNNKRYTKEEAELYGVVKANEIRTFNHLHLELPGQFVDFSGKSVEALVAAYRDKKQVFSRAMSELPFDTLSLVEDLINQGSLLDGTTHLHAIKLTKEFAAEYEHVKPEYKEVWLWEKSYFMEERIAKFKNTLIGVLCTELAEGLELNKACENWNKRVDPTNYMKAVAPITKKQIEEARKFVEDNGYEQSFDRRFATLDDIKVTEIKHVSTSTEPIKRVSVFDGVKANKSRHKRNEFKDVEEVSIEKFMTDILPNCSSVEAFLSNKHENNLVALTTANIPESKPIFKWNNNYSWTYNGNLAGKSQIKEAVKTAGGAVNGVLRFSIMWAEQNIDNSDLDAHCIEPDNVRIYFSSKRSHRTGGNLDIDITQPKSQMPSGAVENITYPSQENMIDGVYKFYVHQFAARNSKGFKAEIEFDGQLYSYSYDRPVDNWVEVAFVTLKNGVFSIEHKLPEASRTKEVYNLSTEEFHKVCLISLSPNHWGDNNVGNKHYFFMLEGCKPQIPIRSFHNENLTSDLLLHKKVMEVLGSTSLIEAGDDKVLAGLGFNATVKDELILKLSGNFNRMLKVKF